MLFNKKLSLKQIIKENEKEGKYIIMGSKGLLIALIAVSAAAVASSTVLGIGWAISASKNSNQNVVSFSSNEASSSDNSSEQLSNTESQQTSESSTTPTSESSEGGSSESGESIIPLETKYTIIFDLDGGTSSSSEYYKAVNEFSKDDFFYDCTKPGYTFKGWSHNGKKVLDELGNVIKTPFMADTMVFKAIYSENDYLITYHLNGGTNNIENPDTYKYSSDTISLLNPNKELFDFGGWYKDSELSGSQVTEIHTGSTGNVDLYARWVLPEPYGNLKCSVDGNDITITGVYDNNVKNIIVPSKISTYTVKSIASGAFSNCQSVESITLPFVGESKDSSNQYFGYIFGADTKTSQNDYVPSSLKDVTILNSATTISNRAFYGCNSIETLELPNSIVTISSFAFSHCEALTSITIPSLITKIESNTFEYCTSLQTVIMSPEVDEIKSNAFYNCSSLTSITSMEGVEHIRDTAFFGCSSLTNIALSRDLLLIGEAAFGGCAALNKVDIHKDVQIIKTYAFYGCNNLTIKVETGTSTSHWATDWNPDDRPVSWGIVYFYPDPTERLHEEL